MFPFLALCALAAIAPGGCADPPPCNGVSGPCEKVGPRVLDRRGVSLSGAEFGNLVPGTFGKDYTYPTSAEVDYYVGKGLTHLRVPFRWERLQPALNAPLNDVELARLDAFVDDALAKGAGVLLDPHNYARYNGGVVGGDVPNAAFADFWTRVAEHFKARARVDFGLMNEPHDMPTEQWVSAANDAIAAIRATGARNLISVPGNAWQGARSWPETWYGTSNAIAMLNVVDPADNIVFEAHQYLDEDASGSNEACVSEKAGADRLAPFTAWLRANHKRGWLGEFAGGTSPTCLAAVDRMLDQIDANADVYVGWTWWGAGPWWGNYMFTVEPDGTGADRPQMNILTRHLTP